jgi:hypothetical protein
MHRTPRHHAPCSPPPCTMHCTAADFTPHPRTPRSTTNQLNKRLDEMTAALARVPNTNPKQTTATQAQIRTLSAIQLGSRNRCSQSSNDENTRSIRPTNAHKKAKVGSTNVGAHDQNFTGSADPRGLSACAICLSRNPHDVTQCDANLLWDGHTPSFARKGDKGAKLRNATSGDTICLDWNLPRSCSSNSHLSRHRCSGCGDSDHGAQTCRLAQPKI